MPNREILEKICRLVRYDILTSTNAAGSGHTSSSLSAVELMAVLFFAGFLRFDSDNPKNITNDRVVFSKGHAAPLLYSLYQAAGIISYEEIMTLRKFGSRLEGHPMPRFPYADVATGSLGQGMSIGLGMALGIKLKIKNDPFDKTQGHPEQSRMDEKLKIERTPKIWVLLGDSEMSEGQIWEGLQIASYYKLKNLIGILDVNRLGQRGETMLGWDLETYERRISSFGWQTIVVDDGHDIYKVYEAFKSVEISQGQSNSDLDGKPMMIIAKTVKGKGVSFLENAEGWHGKALTKYQLDVVLKELGEVDLNIRGKIIAPQYQTLNIKYQNNISKIKNNNQQLIANYTLDELVSTREAYGDALVEIGKINPVLVVLDAEVSNSTLTEKFKNIFPERFFEMFIAEQNMISTALGLSKIGFIPFVSTFSAFLSRAFDQIRIAQYSEGNLKIVCSHAGVFVGPDGPSQEGLEDIGLMRSILNSVVLHPSDAVSAFKLTMLMAKQTGISYLRTMRDSVPVIYPADEEFSIGGSKILRQSEEDSAVIIAAGVVVHEALKAYDLLAKENLKICIVDAYSIKPIDSITIKQLAINNKQFIIVEDHYPYGGLGDAVREVFVNTKVSVHHLCVRKIPRSGSPQDLLRYEEIDSEAIVKKIRERL